jgi:alanyl-tRNA synthetase
MKRAMSALTTERLYYADSFLTEFQATVTDIQELSRDGGRSLWRVALDRSAFYPDSGGQPHDTGFLLASARSGAELKAEVADVQEDEAGEVWHHIAKPLSIGATIHGSIDAARRLDHVQQHSGQHLLSAAFYEICQARTVSFHLGDQVSTVDLATESLSEDTLHRAEELANRVVAEDRPMTVRIVSRAQAEAWLAAGEMRKLPPREGDMRIVEIAGSPSPLDRNACGGTHARSTGQLGAIQIRRVERAGEVMRVEFVCGLRAVRAARSDFEALSEVSRLLSVGLGEAPESISRLQQERKQAARKIEAVEMEIIGYRAAGILRETPVENGRRIVVKELLPPEIASPTQAKQLARELTAQDGLAAAIVAWRPGDANEPATLILAHGSNLQFDCGATLRQVLNAHSGRGGGTQNLAQGSIPQEHLAAAVEALAAAARRC